MPPISLGIGFGLTMQGRGGGVAPPEFQTLRGYNIRVPFGYSISDGEGGFAADPYALGGSGDWETVVPPALISDVVSAGANVIRLLIDPGPLMVADASKRAAYYVRFDEAITSLVDAGLIVVVNLHPQVQNPSDPAGYGFEEILDGLEGTKWTRFKSEAALLGAHLQASFDRTDVLFEPHNEPPDLSGDTWRNYMVALHTAIRAAANRITIIVTAENYTDASALAVFEPLDDPNTIHSFHHYHPVIFTFQTQNEWTAITRQKWPPYGPDKAGHVSAAPSAEAALDVYFDTPQDMGHLAPSFDAVADWADTHEIARNRIWLGEFGAWGDFGMTVGADLNSRVHYHRAMRLEAEAKGFSWCAFQLISPGDGFGLSSAGELVDDLTDALFGAVGTGTIDGATAGTPGTLPTGWDGSDTSGTWRVFGVGTTNGIPWIELEVSGGYLNLVLPNGWGGNVMAQNEVWEASAYFLITSGSFEFMRWSAYSFGGGTQETNSAQFEGTFGSVTELRHGFRRHLHTVSNAAATSGNAMLTMTPTSSGTARVRIGAPQFRKL